MCVYNVIIIGAGPAGIATAIEATKRGVASDDILVLERSGEISHMIASKYPDEKPVVANYKGKSADDLGALRIEDMSKTQFMNFLADMVDKNEIAIRYHQTVKRLTKLKNGQISIETEDDILIANSVFLAIGTMAAPRSLGVPVVSEVTPHIYYDIQHVTSDMNKILVIGGGDSASEYAQILCSRGKQVTLAYRGPEFTKMTDHNREAILKLKEAGLVEVLVSTELSRIDSQNYRPEVFFGSDRGIVFDGVIAAIGSERPANYLKQLGIEMGYEGNHLYAETSLPGVFLVGDIASGSRGGTINLAFNSAYEAFQEAEKYYLA